MSTAKHNDDGQYKSPLPFMLSVVANGLNTNQPFKFVLALENKIPIDSIMTEEYTILNS